MITNKNELRAYGNLIIKSQITLTIIGVLIASGCVSVFSTLMMVEKFKLSMSNIVWFSIATVALLVLLDFIKRYFYALAINNFVVAQVEKVQNFHLMSVMTFLSVLVVIMIDGTGAYSTAVFIEQTMQKSSVTDSLDFEILEQNKEAEAITLSSAGYQTALDKYNQNKQQHIDNCNQAWRVPRYRTKNGQCMDKWKQSEPIKSDFVVSASINKDDIEKIKEDNSNFFTENIFYMVFGIVGLILLVLNFLTLTEMYQKLKSIRRALTNTRIEIVRGHLEADAKERDESERRKLLIEQTHAEEQNAMEEEAIELNRTLERSSDEKMLNELKTRNRNENVKNEEYKITLRGKNKKSKTQKSDSTKKHEKLEEQELREILLSNFDESGKIISKKDVINIDNREQDKLYKKVVGDLMVANEITYRKGYGYYIAS